MLKEFMCENTMLHVYNTSFSLPISGTQCASIQTHTSWECLCLDNCKLKSTHLPFISLTAHSNPPETII